MHSRAAEACENEILAHIVEAIEADRKQRDIYELLAEALDDRAAGWDESGEPDVDSPAHRAAQELRGISNEVRIDTAWDDHIGPMLDRMEQEYGA